MRFKHIERERFDIKDYLWTGTMGAAASLGQALVVVFIAHFVLASGSSFRRKVVKIAGPTFARRRITVQVLDEISAQIHRYLLVQVFTSVLALKRPRLRSGRGVNISVFCT